MKKGFLLVILAVLCSSLAAAPVQGASLSPGLSVLAAARDMVVSAPLHTDVRFTAEDFRNSVGRSLTSVTVTELPPISEGVLLLANAHVLPNQTIPLASLAALRFSPTDASITASSFRFTTDRQYETVCSMRFLTAVNHAPVITVPTGLQSAFTQADISVGGTLPGSDPDNDAVRFEIVAAPEHGLLRLTDAGSGQYLYTPFARYTGDDSFTYRIRDSYGAYSAAQSVAVHVSASTTDIRLADVPDGSAYGAALVMASRGYMDCRVVGGSIFFQPDKTISRENYLVAVMNALGADRLPAVTRTVFSDDSNISEAARPYVTAAYSLGIIKGVLDDTGLYFKPQEAVTRAEAAVILNRIIGAAEPEIVPVFADADTVPVWARSSVYALHRLGILPCNSGKIAAADLMTRAETAETLLTVLRLTEKIG